MNQSNPKVVFVGNIPFGLSEQQLTEVFKEVGPVANFRLMFDRETGKPKGFGFCEFYDSETAASAVRNLNHYEISGRQLKVDYADNEDKPRTGPHGAGGGRQPPQAQKRSQLPLQPPPMSQPPMPQPPPMHQGMSAMDEISNKLANMTPQDHESLIRDLQHMAKDPVGVNELRNRLTDNPQLTYAIFQVMVMLDLVPSDIIAKRMQTPPSGNPMRPGTMPPQGQMPPPHLPPQRGPPPPSAGPAHIRPPYNQPLPQMMAPPPQSAMDEQRALIEQVRLLTEEQINSMPPEHREQIRMLKAQLTERPI